MNSDRTFSESWHKVAPLRLALRASVQVRRQNFRGQIWYVFYDPFTNAFVRVIPDAYEYIARLDGRLSVHEVWHKTLETKPTKALGQEGVLQVLAQLYAANLLHHDLSPDIVHLFERYKKRRQRLFRSRFLSLMFARFPLYDPNILLDTLQPIIRLFFSPGSFMLWLVTIFFGLKNVLDNFSQFQDQSQAVLAPENIGYLLLCIVVIKALHELGHAAACKRYGGEVHTLGIMLLVFTPLPYMDASSSWNFRNRSHRALVGGAGILVELFIAALASIVWAKSGTGIIHSLAFNTIFAASVSTLLFNANPLLRYDGYYVLSDLLEMPNLQQRSFLQLKYLTEKYLFHVPSSPLAPTRGEAIVLTLYGLLSSIYRVLVTISIILFVGSHYLLLGVCAAIFCTVTWVLLPAGRLNYYLFTDTNLSRHRTGIIAWFYGVITASLLLATLLPVPHSLNAPGILESKKYQTVNNKSAGIIQEIRQQSAVRVQKGTLLIVLEAPELPMRIASAKARILEIEALQARARHENRSELPLLTKRMETAKKKLSSLLLQQKGLRIMAPSEGMWIINTEIVERGGYVPRGADLGFLIDEHQFRFTAVINQDDAAHLFSADEKRATLRLRGRAHQRVSVASYQIIPYQQEHLPSAALGFQGGGSIAVSSKDDKGLTVKEPFFQVFASFNAPHQPFFHGQSGKIYFSLAPQPFAVQIGYRIKQLLQKRYSL